jgi:hypothetical protein
MALFDNLQDLEHDPEKWEPVSRLRERAPAGKVGKACPPARAEESCSNNKQLDRDKVIPI